MSLPSSEPIPPEPDSESNRAPDLVPDSIPEAGNEPEKTTGSELPADLESDPIAASALGAESEPEASYVPPRRRRARRRAVPWELDRRIAFFRELSHQATPSFDFFLFSVVGGAIAGIALLLDSPALFILAALLSPFMSPVLGMGVSAAIGSLGFFLRSLITMAIGGGLVFGVGMAAGWLSANFSGLAFSQAVFHTTFTWPDLTVVLLGAAFTAYLAVRSPQQRPLVSSVALAYELYLPLAASGFGLARPLPGLFPDGLILFGTGLALAAVVAALVLIFQGVRPLPSGLGWLASLFLVIVLAGAALFGVANNVYTAQGLGPLSFAAQPSPTPSATATLKPSLTLTPQATISDTPQPTRTPTNTLVPTATATPTLAPSATPVYGLVNAGELNGVIIRPDPGSLQIVTTLLNGSLVEILPEVVSRGGSLWIHVRAPDGKDGWVQSGLIVTATPRPR